MNTVLLTLGTAMIIGIFLSGVMRLNLGLGILGAAGTGYLCLHYTHDLSVVIGDLLKSEGITIGGGGVDAIFMFVSWIYIAVALFALLVSGSFSKS